MARLIQQPSGSGPSVSFARSVFLQLCQQLKRSRGLEVPSSALIISITYNPSSLRPF